MTRTQHIIICANILALLRSNHKLKDEDREAFKVFLVEETGTSRARVEQWAQNNFAEPST